jgi:hypothetical protein
MGIVSQIVWLAGLLLETTILVRSIQCKSFGKYSLFYAYIASVLAGDTVFYFWQWLNVRFYWQLEFLTMALGCGVIVEISRHVFVQHTSLDRFARWIAVIAFGTIFLVFSIHAFLLPNWKPATNAADLERDLRIAQAIGLLTIVFLTGYYAIEIGKNMKGLILGFGVYVGASIVALTLQLFIGRSFTPVWVIVQPFSYLAALLIWAVALWSYAPVPARPPTPTDADYQRLVGRTRQALGSIQEHLDRTPQR